MIENTINKFEEAFYVENKDIIDGLKIGISYVGNNNFNNNLLEKIDGNIFKAISFDIEQTEIYKSKLDNTTNNKLYIVCYK